MLTEALLAYAHFVAILGLVVFVTSEAALCRTEWLNAAVVRRLVVVDRICVSAAILVLLTGLVRTWLGAKGMDWYWQQPLLHAKVALYGVGALMSIRPTQAFRRWRQALDQDGSLPADSEIKAIRRLVMWQAHLLVVIPLAATLLARGVWTR